MKQKTKSTTYVICLFFLFSFLLCVFIPKKEYSSSERRPLESFPKVTWNAIVSGRFMDEFEEYALDHFPFRDSLRAMKACIEQYVYQKKSSNDIYIEDNYAAAMVYPMNAESMENAADVFAEIYQSYLKNNAKKVYFSMIPDKNYFLNDQANQLSMNYADFMNWFRKELYYMEYIDLTDVLAVDDYYYTDSHWKQSEITDAASKINEAMGSSVSGKYEEQTIEREFYGVYSGQWALPLKADKITYLTNDLIDGYEVYDYENNKSIPVYNLEKAEGDDMYELFLNGSISLLTIQNPSINSKKELILFRDSFGSSIAPMLAEGYSKVTLIDIRYIRPELLGEFVDFTNKDVLFLYSTALLNNNDIR